MKYGIRHQDSYSRGELLLRTLFGFFYIMIPHFIVLYFLMIASSFLGFITFWAILITGKFPKGMFNFQVNLHRWQLRLNARMSNLADGYPAFGLGAQDDNIQLEVPYPETSSRGKLLLRMFFGIFLVIPHAFCLLFVSLGAVFVRMLAFWIVLFTGKYPKGMHNYMVGTMRWGFRVNAYMGFLTDTYPPFSMAGNEADFSNTSSQSSDLLDN